MKQLSIFVDESGDFGFEKGSSDFYIVTMVFHKQIDDITYQLNNLEDRLNHIGISMSLIHTGPIIKKKEDYSIMSIKERKDIMYSFLDFIRYCPVSYNSIIEKKKDYENKERIIKSLSRKISDFFMNNLTFFQSFEQIVVYYDNGQQEIKNMLEHVFGSTFSNVDFRNINPRNYRLFQVSDYICSIELLATKLKFNMLTKSEKKFFYLPQELSKQFIKVIRKKHFNKCK